MEIFKYNILFTSWGEIYAGLKRNWLVPDDVFNLCKQNNIESCNLDRITELQLALDESLFQFYEKIKKIIIEDKHLPILKNEDEIERDFNYIPEKYWEIWKLEFLLKIRNDNKSGKKEKLMNVTGYFHLFDFPDDWKNFIYYQPGDNQDSGIDSIYENFISYIDALIRKSNL